MQQDYSRNHNEQNFRVAKSCIAAVLLLGLVASATALSVTQPVNFDNDTLGAYDKHEFLADWGIDPWNSSGQKDDRLHIVYDTGTTNKVLEVKYLSGAVGGNSAMAFTAPIGVQEIKPYRHLFFQYKVKFAAGFPWVKGGKLPGLTSGNSPSGCIDNGTFTGFSARRMWRENGVAWSYLYTPDKAERCGDYYAFNTYGNIPVYTNSQGVPADPRVQFKHGVWNTLTQEVQLNEPGVTPPNGFIKEWLNGTQVLDLEGLDLDANTPIDQLKIDTFYGGSDATWAPPDDEYAYFDEFSLSTTMPAMY